MKVLIALALVIGVASSVPVGGGQMQIPPAMRTMMLDMMKNMLKTMLPQNNGPPANDPSPIAPMGQIPPLIPSMPPANIPPPGPAFVPNMGPMPNSMPPQAPPGGNNNGAFMEMPASYGGYGGGYGGGFIQREFCPPNMGPAGYNDACKDQILRDALYINGKPRYKWVTPLNPYDPSIPDNLKDYARHVLYKKIGNRAPTPQEAQLMSILGDPPGYGYHHGPMHGPGVGPMVG